MLFFAQDVWPKLKKNNPDLIMDVVGKNPPKELTMLASRDSKFRVHGFVDDVRTYLAQASIYVCPIRDGGGTKLKLLDAFAMGKAVIAHPAACEGIDVTENINVMIADTAEGFLEKIEYLLNNNDVRQSLGKSARKLVESKYSFVEIGNKLSQDYEELIKIRV